jgi:hypothetical protein
MRGLNFKNSVCLSLLGHLAVFSLFSFSFGQRLLPANQTPVYFWGAVLNNYDLRAEGPHYLGLKSMLNRSLEAGGNFIKRLQLAPQEQSGRVSAVTTNYYYKPPINLGIETEKRSFPPGRATTLPHGLRKESVVTLHPVLPYYFTLYFKDRQVVHIELLFNIISGAKTNAIVVKRKISSGNLEVDLLSMRYISHYLFIQQAKFVPDHWQTVRIEFYPKK